jgi:hypothetical protein
MAPIRTKNRFGRRYIRLKELCDYAVDLDLCTHPPHRALMEFMEKEGLLTPLRRIQIPPEILRRFTSERYPDVDIVDPVEPDGQRLDAATNLMEALERWADARIYGESTHALDALDDAHIPFIQTDFLPGTFTSWEDRRVRLYQTDGGPILSNPDSDTPTFYHYWQIFWLATILRSGVHIYFPLDDEHLGREILRGNVLSIDELRGRARQIVNIEAYHELRELREYECHFEAVGYFHAYKHNALQTFTAHRDEHGRIPHRPWQQYLTREREIARDTFSQCGLSENDFIAFIGKQCEWWDHAHRVGPAALAEEYKRNINASIGFLRAATEIDPRDVVTRVGRCTSHFRPTLEVIFPDWTEEQRDLTIGSLKRWADDSLASLPVPFAVSEAELGDFCDWLEDRGLYQYYWHFRRLVDLERRDDPIHRAVAASEVVGFATLCELIANEVMVDRGLTPRGNTLSPKLRAIFDNTGPVDLSQFLLSRGNTQLRQRFGQLANTSRQSLPQRLAQIARIKTGGPHNPVLRAMLSFMAIRNEGAHLGLLRFEHLKAIEMIRVLSLASLMIWKAR